MFGCYLLYLFIVACWFLLFGCFLHAGLVVGARWFVCLVGVCCYICLVGLVFC